MNRPAVKAAATPSGWADDRLAQAYDLVVAVRKGWPRGSAPYLGLTDTLDAIERADWATLWTPHPPTGADPMTQDIDALADRVEALEGPCRETDTAICRAVHGRSIGVARYTASLDAAMTLVPECAFWRLGHDGEGADPGLFKSHILSWTDGTAASQRNSIAIAATPALSLCAAALRALATTEGPTK